MDKLNVLELFAGTRSIGCAFEARGHKVTSYDWAEDFDDCIKRDCYSLTKEEIETFDVIWASPDCTTYSIAGAGAHRVKTTYGTFKPISDYGEFCDRGNTYLMGILKNLDGNHLYYVENPRGMFRHMEFVRNIPRYTVTYCQYGDIRQKPTDIFTNHPSPEFKPPCKPRAACHQSAPRGSSSGTQGIRSHIDRSRIPEQLCNHIVDISEEYFSLIR